MNRRRCYNCTEFEGHNSVMGGAPNPVSGGEIQEAVDHLERAGLFDRKPNQGRLFHHLAARLLRGETDATKE